MYCKLLFWIRIKLLLEISPEKNYSCVWSKISCLPKYPSLWYIASTCMLLQTNVTTSFQYYFLQLWLNNTYKQGHVHMMLCSLRTSCLFSACTYFMYLFALYTQCRSVDEMRYGYVRPYSTFIVRQVPLITEPVAYFGKPYYVSQHHQTDDGYSKFYSILNYLVSFQTFVLVKKITRLGQYHFACCTWSSYRYW